MANNFVIEKNASTQNTIVRLYSIYYPGDWYSPTSDNPAYGGAGRAWPNGFPIRFAEIIGDKYSDINYSVVYGGKSYTPFPINMTEFQQSADGQINDLSISLYNVDNIITNLIEDPDLVGVNTTNSISAIVNGLSCTGIDPRTVSDNPAYDVNVVNRYGRSNASFTKSETLSIGGTWKPTVADSRDLLGAVVSIKTTFANLLDRWPEYSKTRIASNSTIQYLTNVMPYRVGDIIYQEGLPGFAKTIESIDYSNNSILMSGTRNIPADSNIFIATLQSDSTAYVEEVFKIDQLEQLTEFVATFSLSSWLMNFKVVMPARKYYKNMCSWVYRGSECQYPTTFYTLIPGTGTTSIGAAYSANSYFTIDNVITADINQDACAKSYESCEVRHNTIHFGGFPGVGRTLPRM